MTTAPAMRRLTGVPAAPGVARGPWAHVRRSPIPTGDRLDGSAAALEAATARLDAAAGEAADELFALGEQVAAAGHEDEAAIFSATAAMAWDPVLRAEAVSEMRERGSAPVDAILAAGARMAARIAAVDDELIAARSSDVLDVVDRIARHLAGLPADEATLHAPAVVVAHDLSPSLTATLPRERILGIVLEGGSPTAHAATLQIVGEPVRLPVLVEV